MKKTIFSFLTGCLIASTLSVCLADNMPKNPEPLSEVLTNLQSQGYTVKRVQVQEGKYQMKGMDQQGHRVAMSVDPSNGEILNSTQKSGTSEPLNSNPGTLSALDAVKKVEQSGYHQVYKLETGTSEYDVSALDKDNKKMELTVDMKSGKISKKMF
jgi:hypothetical protein